MGAGRFENPARKKESFDPMSEACIREITAPEASSVPSQMPTSTYVATAKEALWNCNRNYARTWYKDDADPDDPEGNYAFQRLRQTWFTPSIKPKFTLQRDDKFYAIGSCFARGLESSLIARKMAVESAAPEFARLQAVNKEVSGLGFINKYNTFSILNELRWALDPEAVFPVDSIAQDTEGVWSDPHSNPALRLAGLEQTFTLTTLPPHRCLGLKGNGMSSTSPASLKIGPIWKQYIFCCRATGIPIFALWSRFL